MTIHDPESAAAALRVSVTTVYNEIRRGRLQCSRVGPSGGRIRITDEQISDYLASCQSTPRRRAGGVAVPDRLGLK